VLLTEIFQFIGDEAAMIEVLTSVITSFLSKLSEQAILAGQKEITKRRSLFAALIELYNALDSLQGASEKVYIEFDGYQKGEAVAKVIAADRLNALNKAFKEFLERYKKVTSIISIYDQDLHLVIYGAYTFKHRFWADTDMTDFFLPRLLRFDGKLSYTLEFPQKTPNIRKLSKDFDYPTLGEIELNSKLPLVKEEVIRKFDNARVEINSTQHLKKALAKGRQSIKRLAPAKEQLGGFIRSHFPLDSVLD
jgi:hypothetical protein